MKIENELKINTKKLYCDLTFYEYERILGIEQHDTE
jgi:hypothetical protein